MVEEAGGAGAGAGMFGGPVGIGIGLGANLLGGLLKSRGEKRRLKKIQQARLAALQPLEALLKSRQFGPSQSEGNIMQMVTQQTIGDLQQRGMINSSVAAPQIAQAVAPIEEQRQRRTQGLMERIAAEKSSIATDTAAPGWEDALGDSLGQLGGYATMISARNDARKQRDIERQQETEQMKMLIDQTRGRARTYEEAM